jgi:hypothetical protein
MIEKGAFHLKNGDGPFTDCALVLRISRELCSFAVVDAGGNLQVLYSGEFNPADDRSVKGLLSATEAGYKFASTRIAVETSAFTLVPVPLFSGDELPAYGELLGAGPVQANEVSSAGLTCLSNPGPLASLLREAFPSATWFSYAEPLISASLRLSPRPFHVVLHFNPGSFEMLVAVNGQLRFYNIFPMDAVSDFNYYLAAVLSGLSIDSRKASATVSGEIEADDERYRLLTRYFPTTDFADPVAFVKIPPAFGAVPPHRYFSLAGLTLCE